MIDVAAAVGRPASPLASEGALGRRARRAAPRAHRCRRRGDRRDLRPVPLRRGGDAAREPAAGVGAGRRRRGDARAGHGPGGAPRDRAGHPATASRAGRTCSGRSARSGSSSDGRTLAERGGDEVDTICDLLLESDLAAPMILHYASDEAVRTIAAHPLQLVGSDGIFGPEPHPRLYGTAPRFLGRLRDPRGPDPGRGGGRPADRPCRPPSRPLGPRPDRARPARRPRPARPVDATSTPRPTRTRSRARPACSASGSPGRPSSATAPSPAPAPAASSAAEPLARSPRRDTPDDDDRQHRRDECGDPVPEHDVDHRADGEHGGENVEGL